MPDVNRVKKNEIILFLIVVVVTLVVGTTLVINIVGEVEKIIKYNKERLENWRYF